MSARSYLELPVFSPSLSKNLPDRVPFGPSSSLSPLQNQVDQVIGGFIHEATDWKILASMMAGSVAYRLGRMGMMSAGMGHVTAMPLRIGSIFAGLAAEVSAFEVTHRGWVTVTGRGGPMWPPAIGSMDGHPHRGASTNHFESNLWKWSGPGGLQQGLLQSFITFGSLKGAGRLAQGQNMIAQHLFQDSAMVLGHQISGSLGIAPRPEGTLAEQFLHAEATNLQIGAGMALVHRMAPRMTALERGLDLSLNQRGAMPGSPSLWKKEVRGDFAFAAARQGYLVQENGARKLSHIYAMSKVGEEGFDSNARFFELAGNWIQNEILRGSDAGREGVWHGEERIFEPLDGELKLEPIELQNVLEELRKLPAESRRVLEYTLPENPGEWALNYVFSLHQEFKSLGLYLCGKEGGEFKLRIPSLPLLESVLKFRFGDQALKFAYTEGEEPKDPTITLLGRGERPLGLPVQEISLNGLLVHPFQFALHDLYHIVRWSAAVPAWMRTAAVLYYETHREFLEESTPSSGLRFFSEMEMHRIADLGLYSNYGLSDLVSDYVRSVQKELSLPLKEREDAIFLVLRNYLGKSYLRLEGPGSPELDSHRKVVRNLLEGFSHGSE